MPTESLPCKLTDDEVLDRTTRLLDAMNAEDTLDAQLVSFKERHKEEASAASLATRKLRTVVSTRTEYRDVETVDSHDYKRGVVEVIRIDTHELVRTRPMNEGERQSPLFESEKKAKKRTAKDAAEGSA